MVRYFNPLRRKLGVLVLVMACVFMAAWIRGLYVRTEISVGRNDPKVPTDKGVYYNLQDKGWYASQIQMQSFQQFVSSDGLTWRRVSVIDPECFIGYTVGWRDTRYDPFKTFFSPGKKIWRWQFCGIDAGDYSDGVDLEASSGLIRISFWHVPYGLIVVPLTLISAYLLLSKPGQKSLAPKADIRKMEEDVN